MRGQCIALFLVLATSSVLPAQTVASEVGGSSGSSYFPTSDKSIEPATPMLQFPTEDESLKSIRLYRLSVAAVIAANAVDSASSWGKYERNGVIAGEGGVFDQRSLLLKAGVLVAVVATQHFLCRGGTGKARKIAAIMNFTTAAAYGAVAMHNYQLRR